MSWTKLEEVFQKAGLPYSRQGSYSDVSEYPNGGFFTFWNPDTPNGAFYDNEAHSTVWTWRIYYYTNDPSTLYSKMDEFKALAKASGFVTDGEGNDIKSDRPDYPGREIEIKYIEDKNQIH